MSLPYRILLAHTKIKSSLNYIETCTFERSVYAVI